MEWTSTQLRCHLSVGVEHFHAGCELRNGVAIIIL